MSFIFYCFTIFAILSGILVISSPNPIHSILFFILVICNVTGYLFLLHIEFLALIFLVVYVGAISILFLFVVMMLNIRILELGNKLLNYFSINSFVLFFLLIEVCYFIFNFDFNGGFLEYSVNPQYLSWVSVLNGIPNILVLGQVLYLYYFDFFLIAGFILLVSMIASIILTLEYKIEVRNPNIYEQIIANTSLRLKK
jgi:NADH-quinone oxidoreductase subunit J